MCHSWFHKTKPCFMDINFILNLKMFVSPLWKLLLNRLIYLKYSKCWYLDQTEEPVGITGWRLKTSHASLLTGNPLLRRSVASPDEQIALDLLADSAVRVTILHHLGAVILLSKEARINSFHLNIQMNIHYVLLDYGGMGNVVVIIKSQIRKECSNGVFRQLMFARCMFHIVKRWRNLFDKAFPSSFAH